MDTIEQFYQELFQEVLHGADASGSYKEDMFFERFCSYIIDDGELETADRVQFRHTRGVRIDGYGGDPIDSGNVLNLIIADYCDDETIQKLNGREMKEILKRASNFLEKSLSEKFRASMEETTPAYGLADLIAARWDNIVKVRIILISNRLLSTRIDGVEAGKLEGIQIRNSVWDIGRLYRYYSSGREREDIEIDLLNDFGSSIPALSANLDNSGYKSYLAVVPGQQLAAIYDKWDARLLEQNVRVFLQARGKVNKGLRITLENNPDMFFAYNNGITATAEEVTTKQTDEGLAITHLRNFQIVNGGQTTASIYTASKNAENNLSDVYVQMKLSVVAPEVALEIVPKISEYANTQNRVSAADFFSNHPFHVRIENFSRRLYAPSADGTLRQSKWFYERARGQYQDARGGLTTSQRKKFDQENPKSQMFTKTDLAKFLMLWRFRPDLVAKGAQKNFAEFAKVIDREWEKNSDNFNELYFREVVAKAIIFRAEEKLVSEQAWYEGGYRAQVVAYAVAKLAYDLDSMGMTIEFAEIWRQQRITDAMIKALEIVSEEANYVLTNPPPENRNVSEWAKKNQCWELFRNAHITWPEKFLDELRPVSEAKSELNSAVKEQKVLNNIEAQSEVLNLGAKFWSEVLEWGQSRSLLSPKEEGVLGIACQVPSKIPTDKQSIVIIETVKRLQKEGCSLKLTHQDL